MDGSSIKKLRDMFKINELYNHIGMYTTDHLALVKTIARHFHSERLVIDWNVYYRANWYVRNQRDIILGESGYLYRTEYLLQITEFR